MDDMNAEYAEQPGSPITAALVLGALTFLAEGALAIGGLASMEDGSCSAALVSLWLGTPLTPVTLVAFLVGAVRGSREGSKRKWSRGIGIGLAVVAFPFWLMTGFGIANVMGWG